MGDYKKATDSLLRGIENLIDEKIYKHSADKTFTAIIKNVKENNLYDIFMQNQLYTNVPSLFKDLKENMSVKVKIPQGQYSLMYIEGTLNMNIEKSEIIKEIEWNDILNKPLDLVLDSDYVHTDNNYTDIDKNTLEESSNHIKNKNNPHEITKDQIGLNNVDNTADSIKNVNSAKTLTTPRTIAGTIFDGSENIDINYNNLINKPHIATYTIEEVATTNGYLKTYQLKKDTSYIGAKINIPKDMVVKSGDVKIVEKNNIPYEGAIIGDKYIDLIISNLESSHVYIPVKDLVDVYKEGEHITINKSNVISVIVDSSLSSTSTHPVQNKIINKAINEKLDKTGDASNVINNFTEQTERINLTTGEKLSISLGKIKKWFKDLKKVAFTGSYLDLINKPFIPSKTSEIINDTNLVSDPNYVHTDNNYTTEDKNHIKNKNNPHEVTKNQIGLGNVENKSSDTIRNELTKDNVTKALGYTPPTTNTTYGVATSSKLGLIKSGTDITVDASGNVNVNNNSHTHVKANITDFPSSMPASDVYPWAKASSKPNYSWNEISNKPSTFPPSAHSHNTIDDINNADKKIKFDTTGSYAPPLWFASWTASDKLGTSTPYQMKVGLELNNVDNTADKDKHIKEANIEWGGKDFTASYGCIDACMIPDLGANRLAFLKGEAITVEYSRDDGSTWQDYGLSNYSKSAIFSTGSYCYLGKADNNSHKMTSKDKLRITIDSSIGSVYTVLNKFAIYLSTGGSSNCTCSIYVATKKAPTQFNLIKSKIPIAGWSGWNIINTTSLTTYGNTETQYIKIRFLFEIGNHSSPYQGLGVSTIMGFGGVGWQVPSNMARNGHLYSYDASQNAIFPSNVTAKCFQGAIKDAYGDRNLKLSYSNSSVNNPNYFAVWTIDGNEIRTISKANTKIALELDKVNNTADINKSVKHAITSESSVIAEKVGTTPMKIYPEIDSEINFGGTNGSSTIFIGYRAKDSKPIPTNFVFGGSSGTAILTAKKFAGDAESVDGWNIEYESGYTSNNPTYVCGFDTNKKKIKCVQNGIVNGYLKATTFYENGTSLNSKYASKTHSHVTVSKSQPTNQNKGDTWYQII